MKVSDYIVEFFIKNGITDVFGYPGGMLTHLMESFDHYKDKISAHVNYHEQASAFAACGFAQVTERPGVAYATSGPGATNLITGICDAYFDSIPVIFVTGQVNTFESKGTMPIRQKGFQETDIVSMVHSVTKYSVYVESSEDIRFCLEKACYMAMEGRKGPVLLDIPMNVQRSNVEPELLKKFDPPKACKKENDKIKDILELLRNAKRPSILIGSGLRCRGAAEKFRIAADKWKIPVVSSMVAVDILSRDSDFYYGFIGAYGERSANFIIAKSDLVLVLGSRMDVRQIGAVPKEFAVHAKLVRVDVDSGELSNKIKEDEIQLNWEVSDFIEEISDRIVEQAGRYQEWKSVCDEIKNKLNGIDDRKPNQMVSEISRFVPEDSVITTDVGQNQVWIAQSFHTKVNQQILFSGGHGAMGYSLPAAIGAYYGSRKKVISFNGDGGIQMNIQELQFLAREQLPIKVIILNNSSLGMIRHFQEMYFDSNFTQTVENRGYSVPSFEKLAGAYGIAYTEIKNPQGLSEDLFSGDAPAVIEVRLENNTYVYPKLEFGKPNQDQEPLLDRSLYYYLMDL